MLGELNLEARKLEGPNSDLYNNTSAGTTKSTEINESVSPATNKNQAVVVGVEKSEKSATAPPVLPLAVVEHGRTPFKSEMSFSPIADLPGLVQTKQQVKLIHYTCDTQKPPKGLTTPRSVRPLRHFEFDDEPDSSWAFKAILTKHFSNFFNRSTSKLSVSSCGCFPRGKKTKTALESREKDVLEQGTSTDSRSSFSKVLP
jgi:hypothetical protein